MPQPLHTTTKDDDTTSLLLCHPLRDGATGHNRDAHATQPPLAGHPRAQQSSKPRQGQYFPSCRTVLFTTVSTQIPTMHLIALVSEERGKKNIGEKNKPPHRSTAGH